MKRLIQQSSLIAATVMLGTSWATPVSAQLPESGWPVDSMTDFDDLMQDFMADNSLRGGVLGISVNGCIVYQRGFGYLNDVGDNTRMAENTPMRIASVEKPITSAAIRNLINNALGDLAWTDRIFNLNGNGGILNYTPFDGLGDARLANVSVANCFNHMGGWDRDTASICEENEGDPMFDDICIADEMGFPSPPNRDDLIRYMLSEPLQFTPGTNGCLDGNNNPTFCYSNFGYMLLGRVVETISGLSHLNYIRTQILTTDMWIPASEIQYGRTFEGDQGVREPRYLDDAMCTNVFNPDGADVLCPYGSFVQENLQGHGNLVASALPLLVYMDFYQVGVGGAAGTPLLGGGANTSAHEGLLPGASTMMRQRSDGVNFVVLFNKGDGQPAGAITPLLDALIQQKQNDGFAWPTQCVDGFWVDFDSPVSLPEFGGFHTPFRSITKAISTTFGEGVKMRFKPGQTNWTGTLDYQMRLDAPFGLVRIGG